MMRASSKQIEAEILGRRHGTASVPGRTFRVGSDKHHAVEAPAHDVSVDGFWIEDLILNRAPRTYFRSWAALVRRGALLSFFIIICGPASAMDNRLPGAWAQSKEDCSRLFSSTAHVWRFRPGLSKFEQAYIITPVVIASPSERCRITGTQTKNPSSTFHLTCRDSVSYDSMTVKITLSGAQEMVYGFPASPDLNQTFFKCTR
jgi:hypothetical protein